MIEIILNHSFSNRTLHSSKLEMTLRIPTMPTKRISQLPHSTLRNPRHTSTAGTQRQFILSLFFSRSNTWLFSWTMYTGVCCVTSYVRNIPTGRYVLRRFLHFGGNLNHEKSYKRNSPPKHTHRWGKQTPVSPFHKPREARMTTIDYLSQVSLMWWQFTT